MTKKTHPNLNGTSISSKKALSAAKRARKVFGAKKRATAASWKKGGRNWARVLGHFGAA